MAGTPSGALLRLQLHTHSLVQLCSFVTMEIYKRMNGRRQIPQTNLIRINAVTYTRPHYNRPHYSYNPHLHVSPAPAPRRSWCRSRSCIAGHFDAASSARAMRYYALHGIWCLYLPVRVRAPTHVWLASAVASDQILLWYSSFPVHSSVVWHLQLRVQAPSRWHPPGAPCSCIHEILQYLDVFCYSCIHRSMLLIMTSTGKLAGDCA